MKLETLLPLAALPLVVLVFPRPKPIDPLAPDRDLASLAPSDSRIFIEARGLCELAKVGLDHPLAKAVLGSPQIRGFFATAKIDPTNWIPALDRAAGFDVLPTVAKLSARGAALSIAYRRAEPSVLVELRGSDPEEVGHEVADLLALVAKRVGAPGAFDKPAAEVRGADVWRVGDKFAIARRDSILMASNDEAYLRDALELAADAKSVGLAGEATFRSANASRASGGFAWAFADLAAFDRLAADKQLRNSEGFEKFRRAASEPAAQFLLGPGIAAACTAKIATLGLSLNGEDLRFALGADGIGVGAASGLAPRAGELAPPEVGRDGAVAELVVYRDLATLFQKRAELFPPETLPGFAEATTNLGFIFGGMDVGEKVWPAFAPWMRVVAREVAFDANAKPEIPLPAAAFVARIRDVEHNGPLFVSAFQTMFGFLNVERAQQAKPPLVLHIEMQDGVQLNFAQLMPPRAGEGVDIGYNLEPACALVKDVFVVGTHKALVAQLVRELQSAKETTAPKSEHLAITGAAVAKALAPNLDAIAMNAVLKEGKTREQADNEAKLLVAIAELVDHLDLDVRYPNASSIAIELALDLHASKD